VYGFTDPRIRNGTHHQVQVMGSYETNMQIINKNFAILHDMQRDMSNNLAQQSADIKIANASSTELKSSITSTNLEIQALKSQLTVTSAELKWCIASNESLRADIKVLQLDIQKMSSGMADLKTQIVRVFQFLPQFIRHVSANFLKLLVSMKSTVVLEELPGIEY
jgi:chromosome segregation ATPase